MKANEARQLTEQAFFAGTNVYIMSAYKQIEAAAKQGRNFITIKSPTATEIICSSVINQLENDGYKVERNSGYDPRDGDSWDNLYISW